MTQSKVEFKGTVKEECFRVECSARTNGKVELILGTGKNAVKNYYSSYDEMYEDNPEYKEEIDRLTSIDFSLSLLERTLFEVMEDRSNLEVEYIYKSLVSNDKEQEKEFLKLASVESIRVHVLEYLISKAGLSEKYDAWLDERKNQAN